MIWVGSHKLAYAIGVSLPLHVNIYEHCITCERILFEFEFKRLMKGSPTQKIVFIYI